MMKEVLFYWLSSFGKQTDRGSPHPSNRGGSQDHNISLITNVLFLITAFTNQFKCTDAVRDGIRCLRYRHPESLTKQRCLTSDWCRHLANSTKRVVFDSGLFSPLGPIQKT